MGTGPARMVFIALAARLAPGPVISGDTEAVLALSQQRHHRASCSPIRVTMHAPCVPDCPLARIQPPLTIEKAKDISPGQWACFTLL